MLNQRCTVKHKEKKWKNRNEIKENNFSLPLRSPDSPRFPDSRKRSAWRSSCNILKHFALVLSSNLWFKNNNNWKQKPRKNKEQNDFNKRPCITFKKTKQMQSWMAVGRGWTEVAGEVSETFLCKYIADNWGSHAHTLLTLKQLALRAMCCLGFIERGLEAATGPKLGAENWG